MFEKITYPAALIAAARDAWNIGAKIVLVSDIRLPESGQHLLPFNRAWCDNCGGVGHFNLFIADEGPYQSPAAPYSGKVSHWHEGSWYTGESTNFSCHRCNGLGYVKIAFQQREFAQ